MKSISLIAALLSLTLSALADDPAAFDVGAFKFTRPADWSWVAVNSPMRKAQLKVPGAEPGGEVTFFHFGPGGGDAQANVQRWFRQFQSTEGAERTEEMTFGKTKVTLATTEGTFSSGMPGGPTTPMTNFALLGAILDHPEGLVFVKFTGPAALVKASRDKFIDFVKSAAQSVK
jgi:hypothetical protein